ncbi:MAG: hypothetical protein AB8B83_05040 [Bdellovibrionales bacterium]
MNTDQISQNFKAKLEKQAREYHFYSKFYRAISFITLFFGFVICGFIYDVISDGSFMIVFEKPIAILYLFLPFIPSAFFAAISHRKLKKFYTVLEKGNMSEKDLRKRTELYSNKNLKSG